MKREQGSSFLKIGGHSAARRSSTCGALRPLGRPMLAWPLSGAFLAAQARHAPFLWATPLRAENEDRGAYDRPTEGTRTRGTKDSLYKRSSSCHKERSKHLSDASVRTSGRHYVDMQADTSRSLSVRAVAMAADAGHVERKNPFIYKRVVFAVSQRTVKTSVRCVHMYQRTSPHRLAGGHILASICPFVGPTFGIPHASRDRMAFRFSL